MTPPGRSAALHASDQRSWRRLVGVDAASGGGRGEFAPFARYMDYLTAVTARLHSTTEHWRSDEGPLLPTLPPLATPHAPDGGMWRSPRRRQRWTLERHARGMVSVLFGYFFVHR